MLKFILDEKFFRYIEFKHLFFCLLIISLSRFLYQNDEYRDYVF